MPHTFEATFSATFNDEDDNKVTLEQAKAYLENALVVDVDTEENGNEHGFEGASVNLETLKKPNPRYAYLALLKQYGFMWVKNQSTDRVDADGIADVVPAANGFTVLYTDDSVLIASTAVVKSIEYPPDGEYDKKWIRVHWDTIKDERKENASEPTE